MCNEKIISAIKTGIPHLARVGKTKQKIKFCQYFYQNIVVRVSICGRTIDYNNTSRYL